MEITVCAGSSKGKERAMYKKIRFIKMPPAGVKL
jgi:hypothetical protein